MIFEVKSPVLIVKMTVYFVLVTWLKHMTAERDGLSLMLGYGLRVFSRMASTILN